MIHILSLLLLVGQTAPQQNPPAAQTPSDFQTAVEHLQKGRLQAAEPILVRLLKASPNEPDVNEALGMLYGMKGQPQRATPYLEKAVRLKPSGRAYANLAGNYGELGRGQEAGAAFLQALKLEPGNLAANFNLAGLYMKVNAFAQAAPLLERVVRAQPTAAEPRYLLALCYSALNRPAQARSTLLALPPKARDREEVQLLLGSAALTLARKAEARAIYENVLKLNPDSVQGAANLGGLLVSGGETERGLSLLEQAWKKDSTSYLAGYNLALAYKQTGKWEAARSVLASLLTKGETGELYNLLGDVEANLKNSKAAAEYLARAVELDPREAHLFDLGYLHLQTWTLDQAAAVFLRGTEKFPKSGRLWMGLGSAYIAQAKNSEALSAYLRAAEIGDDPRAYRFLGQAYLAANGARADVAARFRRYRLAHPQDAWANFYDGYSTARAGETEQALPLLRRAIELDPKLAAAHFELGNLYSGKGQNEEALAAYQAAVKINPQYQEAFYRLGQAYVRAGRQAEADAALARHEELRKQEAANNEARLRAAIKELGAADTRP